MDMTLTLERSEPASAPPCGQATVATSLGDVRIACFEDASPLRAAWLDLERRASCSHAQSYSWASAWIRNVLQPTGEKAAIVAGYDRDYRLLFIWPFEIERQNGLRLLTWLCQAHANYGMGLLDPAFAEAVPAQDLRRLLVAAAKAAEVDVAALRGQPLDWEGVRNPFARLPFQPSPSSGYSTTLNPSFEVLFNDRFSSRSRNQLKRKEKWLSDLGEVRIGWSDEEKRRLELLEIFFEQKTMRFEELGLRDVFAEEPHRNFFRELAMLPENDPGRLHVGSLEIGKDVVATSSGAIFKGRCYLLFSSLAEGDVRKGSPGAILFLRQIEDFSMRGLAHFDMGAGHGRHKDEWCDVVQPRFDSFFGVTPKGRVYAWALWGFTAVKKAVKNNPRSFSMVQRARKLLWAKTDKP